MLLIVNECWLAALSVTYRSYYQPLECVSPISATLPERTVQISKNEETILNAEAALNLPISIIQLGFASDQRAT